MHDLPLRDIHLPESIVETLAISPIAYFVLGALLIAFIGALLWLKKSFKPSLKSQALKNLELIQKRFHEIKDPAISLSEISVFLRRAVMSQKAFSHAAALSGKAWLELLDSSLNSSEFREGPGKILLKGPYQKTADEKEVEKLLELVFRWVRASL